MTMPDDHLRELAAMTLATRPDEIPCDVWIERVGRYVDLLVSEQAIPSDLEAVAHHVSICPACQEELDALVAAVAFDGGSASGS